MQTSESLYSVPYWLERASIELTYTTWFHKWTIFSKCLPQPLNAWWDLKELDSSQSELCVFARATPISRWSVCLCKSHTNFKLKCVSLKELDSSQSELCVFERATPISRWSVFLNQHLFTEYIIETYSRQYHVIFKLILVWADLLWLDFRDANIFFHFIN